MDIIEDNNNILKSTSRCREEHGFNKRYLVFTELSANEELNAKHASNNNLK